MSLSHVRICDCIDRDLITLVFISSPIVAAERGSTSHERLKFTVVNNQKLGTSLVAQSAKNLPAMQDT